MQNDDTERHSTKNEEKSVIAERLIRNLKKGIYKYMTSVSKYVYIGKLDNTINKFNIMNIFQNRNLWKKM